MQLMTGTSDRCPALGAGRSFHCTATLREGQLFDFRRTNTIQVTHFRDYKGVPIFAIVKVSPICCNGRWLLYLSDRHQTAQRLTEPECLDNVCLFL
jgi:hypothetical protein